jgi:hypothetical protein
MTGVPTDVVDAQMTGRAAVPVDTRSAQGAYERADARDSLYRHGPRIYVLKRIRGGESGACLDPN